MSTTYNLSNSYTWNFHFFYHAQLKDYNLMIRQLNVLTPTKTLVSYFNTHVLCDKM